MFEIQGRQLDSKHFIAEFVSENGEKSWWLLEFKNDIINGVVNCTKSSKNDPLLFNMKQIDPNNFEWDGRTWHLIKESS